MTDVTRPSIPTVSVLVLALGIGAYLVVQSVVLAETGGRSTDHLVRTAWFVVLAVGAAFAIGGAMLE